MKLDNAKYTSLSFGTYLDYEKWSSRGSNGQYGGWSSSSNMSYNYSSKYTKLANEITTLEINDFKSLILQKPLFETFLHNVYPSEADAIYGLQQLQYILKYLNASPDNKIINLMKHINSNGPKLKELTLLVDKEDVDTELTLEKIKKIYPYPMEIVALEVIDKAIIEKDPKYAYVQIVESKGGKGNISTHTIAGAADGKMYAYIYPKVSFGIKESSLIKYNERIKDKHFEEYAEKVVE